MSEHDAEETSLPAQDAFAGEQGHHPGPGSAQAITRSADATLVAPVRPLRGKRPLLADQQRGTLLYAVSRILLEAWSLEAVADQLLRAIGETLHWDLGTWWTLEQEAGTLRYQATWHTSRLHAHPFLQMSQQLRFSSGEGLPGRVWATGEVAWVSDVLIDSNFPRHLAAAQSGLHAGCAFPLHGKQSILGVIEFFSQRTVSPDGALMQTLFILGQQIGQFLERLSAEEAVRASEARKAAMLHSALDAVITIGQDGRVLEWNPAAERLFGYARQQAMGQPMAHLIIPPNLREQHTRGLARYLHTGQATLLDQRVEVTGMRADGRLFPVELTITRIDLPGPALFTGYLRDLTERKQAEAEREQLLRLQQANRLKSEFLANMSHELRTPLNGIIGFTEIMYTGEVGTMSEEQREYLGDILSSSRHLLQLINDVLDLAKVESGKMTFYPEEVDLAKLVNEVRDIMRPLAVSKRIFIEVAIDSTLTGVTIDPTKFKQVLYNYLSNAIKFTPEEGRVTVSIKPHDEDTIILEVEDIGIGIQPEDIGQLFVEFQQLDSGTAKKYQGTGLGLALTRYIVEAQGGSVGVRSTLGQGSTFFATLPRVASSIR